VKQFDEARAPAVSPKIRAGAHVDHSSVERTNTQLKGLVA
jgi:hypothetical protein